MIIRNEREGIRKVWLAKGERRKRDVPRENDNEREKDVAKQRVES